MRVILNLIIRVVTYINITNTWLFSYNPTLMFYYRLNEIVYFRQKLYYNFRVIIIIVMFQQFLLILKKNYKKSFNKKVYYIF